MCSCRHQVTTATCQWSASTTLPSYTAPWTPVSDIERRAGRGRGGLGLCWVGCKRAGGYGNDWGRVRCSVCGGERRVSQSVSSGGLGQSCHGERQPLTYTRRLQPADGAPSGLQRRRGAAGGRAAAPFAPAPTYLRPALPPSPLTRPASPPTVSTGPPPEGALRLVLYVQEPGAATSWPDSTAGGTGFVQVGAEGGARRGMRCAGGFAPAHPLHACKRIHTHANIQSRVPFLGLCHTHTSHIQYMQLKLCTL